MTTCAHKLHVWIVLWLYVEYSSAYYPTSDYTNVNIYGFNVKIHRNVAAKPQSLLKIKLNELNDMVNKRLVAVKRAREGHPPFSPTFWLDPDGTDAEGAHFHSNVEWCLQNGRNPDKAKGIAINAQVLEHYLYDQPLMILHEYAHAFENYLNNPAGTCIYIYECK